MSLVTVQLTISGAAQGDSLSAAIDANGVALGDKGIQQMVITAPAHSITYGRRYSGTFTSTPGNMVAAAVLTIGPFSGDEPTRTSEWFFKGTTNDVVNITLVTH